MAPGRRALLVLSLLAFAPGCALFAESPMTADALRQEARAGDGTALLRTIDAEWRYEDIVDLVATMADECFRADASTESSESPGAAYTPTVRKGRVHSELHLQRRGDAPLIGLDPGSYVIVVDIHKKVDGRATVELFAPVRGHDEVVRSVEAWIRSTGHTCPGVV